MTLSEAYCFEPTLDHILETYCHPQYQGKQLSFWLFEDRTARQQARQTFASNGIQAQFYSAYKPLVTYVMDELDISQIAKLQIYYPVIRTGSSKRFLLEAYPLNDMVGDIEVIFLPQSQLTDDPVYQIILTDHIGHETEKRVFAPNHEITGCCGDTFLSPTGWIRMTDGDLIIRDEALQTDYQILFQTVLEAIKAHHWPDTEPFFKNLVIQATLPFRETPLNVGTEKISLQEALHEDLYFSLLEYFRVISGRSTQERDFQPGQIIPDIRYQAGPLKVVVTSDKQMTYDDMPDMEHVYKDLADAGAPLSFTQIASEMDKIPGRIFDCYSVQGRLIRAKYHPGDDQAVVISGAQHANETSGVVGALRAAHYLATQTQAHFTICPVENPDGYALHQYFCRQNPSHMHHAARYTALGDDLEYRSGALQYEKQSRLTAFDLSGAALHLNMHGYPAHEWTRPLSGYLPKGFEMWTIPKGFFLIMRFHSGWKSIASRLIEAVTAELAKNKTLKEFNQTQIQRYQTHTEDHSLTLVNGFPCLFMATEQSPCPMTLITEYPDETIYGSDFCLAHEAQTQTIISAYTHFQKLYSGKS